MRPARCFLQKWSGEFIEVTIGEKTVRFSDKGLPARSRILRAIYRRAQPEMSRDSDRLEIEFAEKIF